MSTEWTRNRKYVSPHVPLLCILIITLQSFSRTSIPRELRKMKTIVFIISCIAFIVNSYADEIDDLALKTQLGQMLIVGFRGTEIDETSYIARVIRDLNPGGVILFDIDVPTKRFPRNIINAEQVRNLTAGLKKISSTPLMIAIDAEGGAVNG